VTKKEIRAPKVRRRFQKNNKAAKDPHRQAWREVESFLNSGADEPNIKMVRIRHILREHPDWKPEKILKEAGFTRKDLADLRKIARAMKNGDVMC